MSPDQTPEPGSIAWVDLTVHDADSIRDFYARVVGWDIQPVGMGGYNDYSMLTKASATPTAGVCHKRGVNANLPSQWLIYIIVEALKRVSQHAPLLEARL